MKQQAKQKQTTQPKTRRRTAATNTHERQARMASTRILSGEKDVSRLLTSAPAAPRVTIAGRSPRASRLPQSTRTALESTFGADLGALRVYYDNDAAALAGEAGARAFASGPDIFFADGQYQPHTSEGLRLIAHETAHVLQQTGRVNADGVMTATPLYGSGEVQRADPPTLVWWILRDTYRESVASEEQAARTSMASVITELDTLVGADATLSATLGAGVEVEQSSGGRTVRVNLMTAFENRVKAGAFDNATPRAKSLLYDTLKLLGRYSGAAYLVWKNPLLQTAAPLDTFSAWLTSTEEYGINFFTQAFRFVDEVNKRYPYNYLEAIWRYLMRPMEAPSGSAQFGQMARDYEANYKSALGTRFLYDNERVRGAYYYLGRLNTELQSTLQKIEQRYTDLQPAVRRAAAAYDLLALARTWTGHQLEVYQLLSPGVVELAQKAIAFWQRARELKNEIDTAAGVMMRSAPLPGAPPSATSNAGVVQSTTPVASSGVQLPPVPGEILADRVFAGFVTATGKGIQSVLGGASLTILNAGEYGAAITKARATLDTQRRLLSDHLPALYTRQNITDQARFDLAVWLAVAQLFLDEASIALDEYDAEKDSTLEMLYGPIPDVRRHHRWRLAEIGYTLGVAVNDVALSAQTLRVLQGDDVGQSYLAFIGEWREDDVSIDRMETDFGGGNVLISNYGLRIGQFRRIFFLLRQQSLVALLRSMLAQSERDLSPESYGVAQRALGQARKDVPYPIRYLANDSLLVWHPSDKDTPGRRDLFDIVTNHPRIVELERLVTEISSSWVIVAPQRRTVNAFVWLLPNFDIILNYVYTIPTLKKFIEENLTSDITPENVLNLLERLHTFSRDPDSDPALAVELKEALDASSRDISAATDQTLTAREQLLHRATIHDRRVTTALAGERLRTYGKNDQAVNYGLPSQAISLIDRFHQDLRHTFPDRTVDTDAALLLQVRQLMEKEENQAHRDLHMTALILSLTDDLRAGFIRPRMVGETVEDRYDLITEIFGYLNLALRISGQANADRRLIPYLQADEAATSLLGKRPGLLDLKNRLVTVIRTIQRRSGFRSTPERDGLQRINRDSELSVSESADPFTIDGVTYQIIRIHTPFLFHPSYGYGSEAYQQSILTDLGGQPISRSTAMPLLDVVFGQEGGDPITITSLLTEQDRSQEVLLEQLSHAVTMKLLIEGLEKTRAIIEAGMRLVMEGAAIVFPPLQAAIIATDFAEFLVNDMPAIRENLFQTPTIVVQALQDFVSPERRAEMLEHLWGYLLFEGDIPFLETIQARASSPRSETQKPGRKKGRLGRFAGNVGRYIVQAFIGLRNRARGAFIRAHRVVERYPLLHRFLRAIPGLLELASMVRARDLQTAQELLGDLVDGGGPANIAKYSRETLDQIFEGLNGLEVPSEIIPMGLVLDFVIERFLKALGWRGKAVNLALTMTNLRSVLAEALADELKAQGLDPNILWQQSIQGELQVLLGEARTDMITGVNGLFSDLFGPVIPAMNTIGLPDIRVATDSENADLSAEPELEPLLKGSREEDDEKDEKDEKERGGSDGLMGRVPEVRASEGRPLPASVRLYYERAFGHDFTHIRLHHDRDADRITSHYRAQALTSGSHIFLSKALSSQNLGNESVIKHELAHVLQQTGPRPLSLKNDPAPMWGQPGRGLRLDHRREAAANRMAQAANSDRTNNAPLSVEEADSQGGLLPAMSTAIVQRTIQYLGSEKVAESFQHQIDTLLTIPKSIANERRGEFTAAVADAQRIWDATSTKLRVTTASTNPLHHGPQTFNNTKARHAISGFFSKTSFQITTRQLRALAFYSYRIRGNRLRLNEDNFKLNLANYLGEATGFDIVIDPNGSTVDYVKVMNIDLGDVHGNSRIYQDMKTETNNRISRPSRGHLPIPGVTKAFTEQEWAKVREQIRGGATDVPIWDDDEFRLGDSFLRKMREMLDAMKGGSVDTWADYTTTDNVSNAAFGGLRVGTHGQLSGSPTGDRVLEPVAGVMSDVARSGRQSHHIPQYLLVEYFQNLDSSSTKIARFEGGKKLFPPGFVVSKGEATGFSGGGKSLNFAQLDPGGSSDRGRGLPAISLAAKTHQKGQLHINATSTWGNFTVPKPSVEITGTPTQGVQLDRHFYGFLRDRMTPKPPDDPVVILKRAHAQGAKVQPAVYEAIRDTYMWMYRGMMGSLRRTLHKDVNDREHWEATSYRTFALNRPETQTKPGELKPQYTPHNTQLAGVANAIEQKNRQIMSGWYRG